MTADELHDVIIELEDILDILDRPD
jgi:hypothetical protein